MKALSVLLAILYLAPPVGVLAFGVATGGIDSFGEALVASVRAVVVAIGAFALGFGLAEKLRFLDRDGVQFYALFYVIYVVLFFVAAFLLGLETQSPDQHQAGRYTY